jgi:uncharacterized protein (DUF849 family)
MHHDPLIIMSAPNGAYKQPSDHAQVPVTAQSLAATARQCMDAGAAMLHLHIRDSQGRHSLDAQGYRDALHTVRAVVGQEMVLQITSEAARIYQAPAQMAMVRDVCPEAVSVGLRELDQPEIGERGLADFFGWLVRERIMTQVIIYDTVDLERWQSLRKNGVIPDAPWFLLFVLGRYSAGQVSSPLDLVAFVHAHSGPEPWAVCAFGASEHACVSAAASLGGHVRVGFENNLYLKDGQLAPDNRALVAQAADAARSLGRPLASAQQIRQRFVPA